MSNTVGIRPGAATMASYPMIEACRACYAAAAYVSMTSTATVAVRRAWARGDAWEVALWSVRLLIALQRDPIKTREYDRELEQTLTNLCCSERLNPGDVWAAA
jgi:hypothetical protein